MSYRVVFTKSAQKDLAKLSQPIKKRLARKIKFFLDQTDPLAHAKHLGGSKVADYRWRVGHYRVGFDVDGREIVILRVRHRSEVYKK